ncbi:MAG TPA: RIP metalloprotease RseP [Caldilineaceae bacterium]|nr:RIP metalloprotease RseP [Caldilineaceae bacterium]
MALTVISFVIVLGVLVFFHELGHYWVARRNGIVVEEFGMGYPPRLVKLFRYDGTDFTLNLIPFGGFARMKGEDMGDMTPGSFNAASRWARAATLVAGPAMNAILAVALFAASYMAGFPAVVGYAQVTALTPAAEAQGLQENDVLLRLNGRPVLVSAVPGFDYEVLQQAAGDPTARTLTVLRAGERLDLPLAADVDQEALLAGVKYAPVMSTEVTAIAEGSPAQQAGLQPGDLIYSVNDIVISANNPLNEVIARHAGQEVTVTLLRGDELLSVQVTPRVNPPQGEGALGVQIGPLSMLATLSLPQALWQGMRSTLEYVVLVLQLPALLLMGQVSPSDAQLTGPVGIAQMVGGAVNATLDTGLWFPIWRLSAVLSAALAVTNLLPLPALDGGRLLFILFEAIRGRRVNPEREGLIHMVGFMLLLGLLVLVTVRDITTAQQTIDWISILGQ